MVVTNSLNKNVVYAQLHWDSRVDAENVDVHVEDGQITLSGTVPTYVDRLAASEDAWRLPGVTSVSNELIVKYPAQFNTPTDTDIKAHISHVFEWHPTLDAGDIEIVVRSGHVELDGIVDSYWHKLAAESVVANTAGVVQISNRLAVVPQENAADEDTARDIVDALNRSQLIDAEAIDVMVENGHVTLAGSVPNADAYRLAHNIAAFTFGVIDVDNKLDIV